jgi:hypothetical protein
MEELQELMQQRDAVVRRICAVKKTVAGLVALFGPAEVGLELPQFIGRKDSRRPGLSDECRLALMNADRPLAAREVRDRVMERMPSLANHRDALASVTTILNRLVRYGEACHVVDNDGRTRWAWVTEHSGSETSAHMKADWPAEAEAHL